jgi:uncharacterized repeat protein (TIGR01451 family)
MRTSKHTTRLGLAGVLVAIAAAFMTAAAPAAAAAPIWRIDPLAKTTAAPGETLKYRVQITNVGDGPADGSVTPIVFSGDLPPGLTVELVENLSGNNFDCSGVVPGASSFSCSDTGGDEFGPALPSGFLVELAVSGAANPGEVLTSSFEIEGGALTEPSDSKVDSTTIALGLPDFGIDAFDTATSADAAGSPYTQAGGHPFDFTTFIDFNSASKPGFFKGEPWPIEPVRDILVDLPPGFVGNPTIAPQCAIGQLANGVGATARSLCPTGSQVGTTVIRSNITHVGTMVGPLPVFNMVPPPGSPARFGFNAFGTVVALDAKLRSGSDYGITVAATQVAEGIALVGSEFTVWGVPAETAHRGERACPGENAPSNEGGPTCPSDAEKESAFLRNPTSCTAPGVGLPTTVRADSWVHPGEFDQAGAVSHLPDGYPYPPSDWGPQQGTDSCENVPFEPSISVEPTTHSADSPTGLNVDLSLPQSDDPKSIATSDLRKAAVTLPKGMTVNPSSANGQGACSASGVGLATPIGQTPIRFDEAPANCPDSAKIGTAEIETQLLDHTIDGAVYLAQQGDNPFKSLLALYIAVDDPQSGVVIKLPGRVVAGADGQLETVFDENPQLPFEHLRVNLFGGPRASLRTPPACGTYATQASLTPWSGNAPVSLSSAFEITSGPSGGACPTGAFDPKLSAGTHNPVAGTFSPFSLRLTRADAMQEINGLSVRMPRGLLGKLAGIPYCPEAAVAQASSRSGEGQGGLELASPSCPASSEVGRVVAGAGAGANPFYVTSGKAYLAGPYKGAPLSLLTVVPALAGPFDLGAVGTRVALHLNPETAQLTAVSDPLPTVLHGIPLDLRDLRVQVDRPNFTLNPTSCDPMSVDAAVSGVTGAIATPSDRFQVSGCDKLAFKPKLRLRLKGGTKRSAYPAFTSVLTAAPGQANIGRVRVALPHSVFLAQNHLNTICTRVQFAADACPKGAIYGRAAATSPLVDYALSGPVYLRSSSHELPDLVVALRGPPHQPIEIDLVGRIDSFDGRIRTTFETVPDAPVSRFVLKMRGGKKSLLENSRNLCAHTYRARVQMDGQNGKVSDSTPALRAQCGRNANR